METSGLYNSQLMVSRRSALLVAQAYATEFSLVSVSTRGYGRSRTDKVYRDELYDFLFEHDYEAWFCNLARTNSRQRELKDWILKLHTGESVVAVTQNWNWEQRERLGNQYLLSLAKHVVDLFEREPDAGHAGLRERLLATLELDGYVRRDGDFFHSEADVLDVEEEIGLLRQLHTSLGLPDPEETFTFLDLSEEHYSAQRWSDSIGNARKFFETLLLQIAEAVEAMNGSQMSERARSHPVQVRAFLEKEGLLEHHEREAIDKLYAVLSHTGAHPYMAEKDQARLLRQLSATLSQFVLLRLEGSRVKQSAT